MAFYIKHGSNTDEPTKVGFNSSYFKGVSTSSSTYPLWVEPFGIKANYAIPVRYVTGDSSAGKQTTWEIKDLYYYPRSSEYLTASSTTISKPGTGLYTEGILSGYVPSSSYRACLATRFLDYYDVNSDRTITEIKTIGPIRDYFPTLFNYIESSDRRVEITAVSNTVSYWAGGINDASSDLWYKAWKNDSSHLTRDITCTTLSIQTTDNIPIVSNTKTTTNIASLDCTFRVNLVELYHGDYSGYGFTYYKLDPKDGQYAVYQSATNNSYSITLTTLSPTQTFTITPVFNLSSGTVSGKSITITATLSGNSVSLSTTQPYALCSTDNIQYTWCGYTTQIKFKNINYNYQSTTSSDTYIPDGSLIQCNTKLHRCYFASPYDSVSDYYGVMQCYSMWIPAADDFYYLALSTGSSIGLTINSWKYTKSSNQSAAYSSNVVINTSLSQFRNYDYYKTNSRIAAADGPIYYMNPWYNRGSTQTEFINYYKNLTNPFLNLYLDFAASATIGVLNSSTARSNTSNFDNYYSITENLNSLFIIAKDDNNNKFIEARKFSLTTYDITLYPLRKNNNYLYNEGAYSENIVLNNVNSGASNKSITVRYINSNNVWQILSSVSNTSIILPAGGYLYFTVTPTSTIKYTTYRILKTYTSYLSFTYNSNYNKANSSWNTSSDSLPYSYSLYEPQSCVGIGVYCYNQLTYSNYWGTSSNTYNNTISSSYVTNTTSNYTSLSYSGTSSTVTNSTAYIKLSATIDTSDGRYNHKFYLYRASNNAEGSSKWSFVTSGTYYNPYYQQKNMGSYTTTLYTSTLQPTYWYYWGEQTSEISYPQITNNADNGSWKRKITVKNPNSYSVTVWYTSNKCTSSSSVDSSATWSNGGSIGANSTTTLYITDRSGYSDAYIVVGFATGSGCYACSSYSESVTSSPTRISTFYASI